MVLVTSELWGHYSAPFAPVTNVRKTRQAAASCFTRQSVKALSPLCFSQFPWSGGLEKYLKGNFQLWNATPWSFWFVVGRDKNCFITSLFQNEIGFCRIKLSKACQRLLLVNLTLLLFKVVRTNFHVKGKDQTYIMASFLKTLFYQSLILH